MKKIIALLMIGMTLCGCSESVSENSAPIEDRTEATENTTAEDVTAIDWLSMSEEEISEKFDDMTDEQLKIVGEDITSDEMFHIKESLSEEQRDRFAEYYVFVDAEAEDVSFTTKEVFMQSPQYSKMQEEAEEVYLPAYDTERYSLTKIFFRDGSYEYYLYDNTEKQNVSVSVVYNTYISDIGDFEGMLNNEKNIMTEAELNGKTYDVYLATSAYGNIENYGLIYLPFEGYHVTIYAGDDSTADEILEYFDDFELVAET